MARGSFTLATFPLKIQKAGTDRPAASREVVSN
jgi:hypothetical protein